MRRSLLVSLTALIVVAGACLAAPAVAGATTFSNTAPITINGGACKFFILSPATPYPSTIQVSGLGDVSDVSVTLTGFSKDFPSGVDVLLVGPGGQSTMLMAHTGGGTAVSGANLSFDDSAAASLPFDTQITSGLYQPTYYAGCPTVTLAGGFPAPAPAGSYGSALSVFNGTPANGTWSLYVVGDEGTNPGSISGGWSLDFTAGPDVSSIAAKLVADSDHVKPGTGLADKAAAIQAAVNANDPATACAAIANYLGLVKAQTGKKLNSTQVALLTGDANNLASALGC